ncbi:hypothetical protein FRB94_006943 [Tulasnella sp. JGI-2019a]|nr:hypothetical protein FRB94_006943 [Tulasnella sp. JGI-2019a]
MTTYHTLKRAFSGITSDNLMQGPLVVRRDHIMLEETSYAIDFDVDFPGAIRIPPTPTTTHWIDGVLPIPSLAPSQENTFLGSQSSGNQQRQQQHLLEDHYEYTSDGPSDDPAQDREDDYNREFGEGEVDLALNWNAIDEPLLQAHGDEEFRPSVPPQDIYMNENHEPWDAHAQKTQQASSLDQLKRGSPAKTSNSETVESLGPSLDPQLLTIASQAKTSTSTTTTTTTVTFNSRTAGTTWKTHSTKVRTDRKRRKMGAGDQVPLLDLSIELTDDQLKDMRNGYEERMLAEKEAIKAKKEKLNAAQNIQNLLHTPFLGSEFLHYEVSTTVSARPLLEGWKDMVQPRVALPPDDAGYLSSFGCTFELNGDAC